MVQNVQNTQTTVTTRTTEQPTLVAPGSIQQAKVLNKEAVVTNVVEKPVLQNVIEKKNVEVHHKPVVQEIHEQKIIEIEKQPLMQNVVQPTLMQQTKAATQFEEIGSRDLGEQERLRLEQLRMTSAPKVVQQQGAVKQFQEQEAVAQVVRQEFVERHVQPVVTEVREQTVVEEVLHPVVRKVHEAPIVREVNTTVPLVQTNVQQVQQVQQVPIQTQTMQRQEFVGTQQPLQQGGNTFATTTTTGTGISGTTTTTSGMGALSTERQNLGRHEQKLLNQPLTTGEAQNLAVHEQAVDSVVSGQRLTGTNTGLVGGNTFQQPLHQGTTTGFGNTTTTSTNLSGTQSDLDNEQKTGFMSKMKQKLHLGHANK